MLNVRCSVLSPFKSQHKNVMGYDVSCRQLLSQSLYITNPIRADWAGPPSTQTWNIQAGNKTVWMSRWPDKGQSLMRAKYTRWSDRWVDVSEKWGSHGEVIRNKTRVTEDIQEIWQQTKSLLRNIYDTNSIMLLKFPWNEARRKINKSNECKMQVMS